MVRNSLSQVLHDAIRSHSKRQNSNYSTKGAVRGIRKDSCDDDIDNLDECLVSPDIEHVCRDEYMSVMSKCKDDASPLYAFLEFQVNQVIQQIEHNPNVNMTDTHNRDHRMLVFEHVVSHTTDTDCPPRKCYIDMNETGSIVSTKRCISFVTVGRWRHCDVHIPSSCIAVSRTHCILMLVPFDSGAVLFVVDMWSRYGTGIETHPLCSVPRARRVMHVPLCELEDKPVTLQLGVDYCRTPASVGKCQVRISLSTSKQSKEDTPPPSPPASRITTHS